MVVRVTRSSKKRVVFIKTQLQRRATGIASKISIVWSNIREVIPIVSQPRRRDRVSNNKSPCGIRTRDVGITTLYPLIYGGEGGKLRRAPSWRKKFRTKDRSRESGDEGEPSGTEGQTQQSPQHSRRQGGADNSMHRRTTEHMMNY
uniref:Uncharacterized protein n=1 Tax=Magallana gigas TaxID=29159 RepID=K1PPW0_MAGGI|eukprot:XP_019921359.1 PREDICTED: uncharacterized protein LOC109618333 [Crassostrea gigas]